MTIIVITKGDHRRNVHMPERGDKLQFAHRYDFSDPEGHERQAQNFIIYAQALGGYVPPVIVYADPTVTDPNQRALMNINLADWAAIVGHALDTEVEIQ